MTSPQSLVARLREQLHEVDDAPVYLTSGIARTLLDQNERYREALTLIMVATWSNGREIARNALEGRE